MTVYFVSPLGSADRVKIGFTTDLNARMQALSSEFEDGIELIARCEGGEDVERAFHAMFAADWIMGEWFRRSEALNSFIRPLSSGVVGRRVWSRLRAVKPTSESPINVDREIARQYLQTLMGKFGAIPFGVAQTRAFEALHEINPMWTRRRVRTIWEKVVRRVDHYEIRDLQAALASTGAEDGPEMEARRGASSPMGRVDLP